MQLKSDIFSFLYFKKLIIIFSKNIYIEKNKNILDFKYYLFLFY